MARIASGNYDAVIVSHRSFEFLPVSDKLFKRFVEEQVEELEAAILEAKAGKDDNRRLVKELEKAKKRFVAKLKERADREGKDNTLTFEELGVDQIFVDEADLYKNLFYTTKMNRIAGLPNSESNRALDMYMKTRYVREINGGRGVVFATGTPISNTMAEMYTMLRYLAPDLLKERGVAHFDAWAANFAEAVTALELAPDGSGYRMHTRFAKFINLPELLSMFRTFADVQTADMLNLPRPTIAGGRPQIAAAPALRAAESLHQDPHQARREAAHVAGRSARGQHAEDHRRRPQGRARHAPGRALRRAGARYQADAGGAADQSCLGRNPRRPVNPARVLRSLDAEPGKFQRLRRSADKADRGGVPQSGDRLHPRRRQRCRQENCCSMPSTPAGYAS